MRISDWSSDVCSSDLPGVAFRNSFDALHFEGAHQVPPELYLSRGYLVLMANPRGDPGYGREYQEAILDGWEYPTRYDLRSEERREGKEWVGQGRSRWSPYD